MLSLFLDIYVFSQLLLLLGALKYPNEWFKGEVRYWVAFSKQNASLIMCPSFHANKSTMNHKTQLVITITNI